MRTFILPRDRWYIRWVESEEAGRRLNVLGLKCRFENGENFTMRITAVESNLNILGRVLTVGSQKSKYMIRPGEELCMRFSLPPEPRVQKYLSELRIDLRTKEI